MTAQQHTVLAPAEGASVPPLTWPRAVQAAWKADGAVITILGSDMLTLVVEAPDQDTAGARTARIVPAVLLAAGGTLAVSSTVSVGPDEPEEFVNVPLLRTLDGLATAEVAATLHQWMVSISAARAAALHLTGGEMWLNRLGDLASAVLGEAARELTFTANDVGDWVEAHTTSGDWWLVTPSVTEALVSGGVMDAFDRGETVDTALVSDALVGIIIATVQHVAHLRGWHPYQVLDAALLRP